jgi:hypothetical protein
MKFRGLLAAAVVLLALAGVLYWSEHRTAQGNAASPGSPVIVTIQPASVSAITVKAKGTAPVALKESSTGKWQIVAPTPALADAKAVSGMLATVHPLTSERVIEDNASDLAQFGLSDPAVEVDFDADGKTTRLLLGDATPVGDAVYALAAGDPRIFTAPASAKTSLDKSENELRDRRLVPVDASAVQGLQLDRAGQTLSFVRNQSGWQMKKPQPWATASSEVDNLVQQVTSAQWDPSSTPRPAAAGWTHAQPFATVTITGKDGSDRLEVRKDKEDYFARSNALPGIWKLDPALLPALSASLNRNLDDFRSKQLFDFAYADPERIEYHSNATTLTLTHSGGEWFSGGQKINADSAEAVVSALRDLAASGFVEGGFSKPTISFAVTFDGGRRVERVDIRPTADGAIARRSDNPSLYSLDATAIDTLTSALAGVKAVHASTPAG